MMDRTEIINRIFDARQRRRSHPAGHTTHQRWYPADTERCDCCAAVRSPSRAYPWSLMAHCRTRRHITQLVDRHGYTSQLVIALAIGENLEARRLVAQARACPGGIGYKALARLDDGRLVSIFDGSPWELGVERREAPRRHHAGGLYVYETTADAMLASVPASSTHADAPRVMVRCQVAGRYCRYGSKLAFERVTPIEIVNC